MISRVFRMRHCNVFIQCEPDKEDNDFMAWSSREPSNSVMKAAGDVYFDFAKTANEAIEKVKNELDAIEVMK